MISMICCGFGDLYFRNGTKKPILLVLGPEPDTAGRGVAKTSQVEVAEVARLCRAKGILIWYMGCPMGPSYGPL